MIAETTSELMMTGPLLRSEGRKKTMSEKDKDLGKIIKKAIEKMPPAQAAKIRGHLVIMSVAMAKFLEEDEKRAIAELVADLTD